jgi:hypothetical protein
MPSDLPSRGVKCRHCGGIIVIESEGQLPAEFSLPCENCWHRAFYSHTAAFALPAAEAWKAQQKSRPNVFGRFRGR